MKEKKFAEISVIIPTLNRPQVLADTITSLLLGEYIPNEIIIVDQSDTILDAELYPDWIGIVKVYKENILSSAHARNVGIRHAKNDIILFCDDDIEINEFTMGRLYKEMQRNDISLVSAINCEDNAVYDYHRKKYRKLRNIAGYFCGTRLPGKKGGYIIKWSMKGHYTEEMTRPCKTDWAYGFFFCVKKSLLDKWDILFDENLIKYAFAEDMDFSCRYCRCSKLEEKKTIVDPRLYVHHLISKEWRMPSEEAVLFGFINRWYLSYKLFPRQWWYRIGMIWSDLWYTLLVYQKEERKMGFKAMIRTYTQMPNLKKGIIKR